MKLLGFQMPPSARIVWKTQEGRDVWQPKIRRASHVYNQLERLTVMDGVRSCTTFHASPERIEDELRGLSRDGLCFLPIRKVGSYSGFAHSHPPVIEGQPWGYYGVISRNGTDLEAFADATDCGDHRKMGNLLGYPECCQEFFSTVWMAGYVDPVWQAAGRTKSRNEDGPYKLTVDHSLLWDGYRYIGVRLVPHLACSFDCEDSVTMAQDWLTVARNHQLEGVDDLLETMELPCEWNCLKGIAEVTTPYFRIVTNSMPCYPAYKIIKKVGGSSSASPN